MNEAHYGYYVNCLWDNLNMLTKMRDKNPQRFEEFRYSQTDIYAMIDTLQHQQHIYD